MANPESSEQRLDSLQKGTEQLGERLTDAKEANDKNFDLHELAIQLSEIRDQGKQLIEETEAFWKELQGPGAQDHETIEQVDALRESLTQLLDEEIPELLLQRSYEEHDNSIFAKGGFADDPKLENEDQVSHAADMHMYPIYLGLLQDSAIDGAVLEPIFKEALDAAASDLDADGVVREWGAMREDTADIAVDKKWIAARPKVADRIVNVYLAALSHPDMRQDGEDSPRIEAFEELVKMYDLFNVIGSPLKEKYQAQLDKIKAE